MSDIVPLIVCAEEPVEVPDAVRDDDLDATCDGDGDKDALPYGLGVVESEPVRDREQVEEAVDVAEAVTVLEAVDDGVTAWLGDIEVEDEEVATCEGVAVGVRPLETVCVGVGDALVVTVGVSEAVRVADWVPVSVALPD